MQIQILMAQSLTSKKQYENFIGGEWVAPVKGQYLDIFSPVTGKVFTSFLDQQKKILN